MLEVAVINPNAGMNRYSGPNVFMERLFANNPEVSATVVTGRANAAEAFPWARVVVPTRYESGGRLAQLRWMAALTLWLWRHSRQFDIVHAHGIYLFNLVPLLAAQMRGAPVVLLPLGEYAELRFARDKTHQPLTGLRRRAVTRAAVGLGLSRRTEQELIMAGLPRERVRSIGNPVDVAAFQPPTDDKRFDLSTLGFVGVLGERKGAHLLLEALSILRSRAGLGSVRALFVGPYFDENYHADFTRRVEQLGLGDYVEVTGYTTRVADHLQRMTVFALPSNQEGLPGALVEAMASGLPAVVTDVGAMGDVVRHADAGSVIPRDAVAIADAIAAALLDHSEWHRLSHNASEYALAHYSIASVQQSYEQALESIPTRWRERDQQQSR